MHRLQHELAARAQHAPDLGKQQDADEDVLLEDVVDVKSLHELAAMAVDGLDAEEQTVGDIPRAVAFGDQLQDLALARREARKFRAVLAAVGVELLHRVLIECVAQVAPPGEDRLEGGGQLVECRILVEIARGTRSQSPCRVLW